MSAPSRWLHLLRRLTFPIDFAMLLLLMLLLASLEHDTRNPSPVVGEAHGDAAAGATR